MTDLHVAVRSVSATVRLTPQEREALARAVGGIVRALVRAGWGWAALWVSGAALVGWAAWTAPTWWGAVRDWWAQ